MDKLNKSNKLRESFENQNPEEQLPEFIWDNVKKELESSPLASTAKETNKIQTSFEGGFEKEVLPVFLWEDIVGELDATSTLDTDEIATNKIKSSFESNVQDKLPTHLWDSVEDKLEIETVWKKVHKALNQRTRKRYWQEKGMQLSLVVLAMLWLRGCDFGDTFTTQPVAYSNETIELAEANPENEIITNKNISPTATAKKEVNGPSNITTNSKEKATTVVIKSTEKEEEKEQEVITTVVTNNSKTVREEAFDSEKKAGNAQLFANAKGDNLEEEESLDSQDKTDVTV